VSTSTSTTYTLTAPSFVGVYLHEVTNPGGTLQHYLYQDDEATESLAVEATALPFIGRTYPVMEYGQGEDQSITRTARVPWSATHDADVAWIRAAIRARVTVCYRDGRGRKMFGGLTRGTKITDVKDGSTVALEIQRLDYTEGV
jgi:hypothetical protein